MSQTAETGFATLRAAVSGEVLTPADQGYDEARRLWNAQHVRHPAVIVRCRTEADVRAAIGYGVTNDLELAVRGGSHSMSGMSSVDDGLMIDLSRMNQVTVDPVARRAVVGGGALLRDLDAATQDHGLAVPAGQISHTGVGGLTLGGGVGWLSRLHGLSIDNLLSVRIVTADGSILRAAEDENPDLFWAVRGGGGNFGVVTEFEFRLHPVGPMVDYGLLFYRAEQGADVLRLARELMPALPPEVTVVIAGLNAPPAPFVPAEHHFTVGFGLVVAGFGAAEQHAEVLERIRSTVPPLFEFVTPMPYVALQQTLDEANDWGHFNYEKSCYLGELSDDVIETITKHVPAKTSPMSVVLIQRWDHAYSAVPDDATAFSGGRSPRYGVFVVAVTPVLELLEAERAWARGFWDALRPGMLGIGSYVNALNEADEDRLRASYGEPKYARLAELKRKYDPDNLFHRNQNIKPA